MAVPPMHLQEGSQVGAAVPWEKEPTQAVVPAVAAPTEAVVLAVAVAAAVPAWHGICCH